MKQGWIVTFLLIAIVYFFNINSTAADGRISVDLYAGINWQDPRDDIISQRVLNKILAAVDKEITFELISSSHARSWKHIQTDNNACVFNALKTSEREKIAKYSHLPISVSPPLRFFATNSSSFDSPFSFSQLSLPLHDQRIGIVKNRYYGSVVDNFIASNPQYFYTNNSIDRSERLLGMLFKGRIDGFFDHSESVQKALKIYKNADILQTIDIKGQHNYLPAYFACANTDMGKRIISLINNAMRTPKFKQWIINQYSGYYKEQEDESLIPYLSQYIYH